MRLWHLTSGTCILVTSMSPHAVLTVVSGDTGKGMFPLLARQPARAVTQYPACHSTVHVCTAFSRRSQVLEHEVRQLMCMWLCGWRFFAGLAPMEPRPVFVRRGGCVCEYLEPGW